jgi:hypothetical protein
MGKVKNTFLDLFILGHSSEDHSAHFHYSENLKSHTKFGGKTAREENAWNTGSDRRKN